jgi:hypothetical protein
MGHLQLVSVAGRHVDTVTPPVRRAGDRHTLLPSLAIGQYVSAAASVDTADLRMRDCARHDARRFARDLSARNPVAEAGGACTWSAAGDLLGEILPLIPTMRDLEGAAHALRLVSRLVMDGEEVGAGMRIGECILSIHGDGTAGTMTIHLQDASDEITLRFRLSDGGRFVPVA